MENQNLTISKEIIDSSEVKIQNKEEVKKQDNIRIDTVSSMNFYYLVIIFMCCTSSLYLILYKDSYWEKILSKMPIGYIIPSVSDFYIVAIITPFLILFKLLCEKYFQNVLYCYLESKYLDEKDAYNFELGLVYKRKLAIGLYKVLYYILATFIGYIILKDMNIMPKELFVFKGDIANISAKVFPDYLFFERSFSFDFYYLMGISFVITDLIWLLFLYDAQSDFYMMLLHHTLTVYLIVFSYLFNLSEVGVLVFYLHDLTDIFVYTCRLSLNLTIPTKFKIIPAILLFVVWLYARIYLYGIYLFHVYRLFTIVDPNNIHGKILLSYASVLFLMNVFWIIQIARRLIALKFVDVGKVQKDK